jgi:hypothetical protein
VVQTGPDWEAGQFWASANLFSAICPALWCKLLHPKGGILLERVGLGKTSRPEAPVSPDVGGLHAVQMRQSCATTPFQYLRDGKLFQIDSPMDDPLGLRPGLVTEPRPPHRIEFFWLCAECSSTLTLAFQRGKGVVTVPLSLPSARQAAAS